jgi:flagellar export protein FliJ
MMHEGGNQMPKHFPLRDVLEHRKRQEEQRQMELASAEAQLARARAAQALAELSRDAVAAALEDVKAAPQVDIYTLQAMTHRHARMQGEVEGARVVVTSHESTVQASRRTATQASQDRLMLERLRDAFEQRQRAEAERKDAERLGEIALARWHANHTEEESHG